MRNTHGRRLVACKGTTASGRRCGFLTCQLPRCTATPVIKRNVGSRTHMSSLRGYARFVGARGRGHKLADAAPRPKKLDQARNKLTSV